MFNWKFKMAAIFSKLYISLPIHGCIDLSNPLRFDRDAIFLLNICNSRGNTPPTKSSQWDILPPFQIEVGGTK